MLDKEDIKQIKNIVSEAVSESTREILEVMQHYAKGVDEKFEAIDEKFVSIDERFDRIEATMVTKSYLDDKIADLRGELVVLTRHEDTKVVTLVTTLKKSKVLPSKEAEKILAMEPFPRK